MAKLFSINNNSILDILFFVGWKIQCINKILYRKDINGTWNGKYEFIDLKKSENDKSRNGNGVIYLIIHQNFFSTKVKSFTEKFSTESKIAHFNYDEQNKKYSLIYEYIQDASKINHDDNVRKGISVIDFFSENKDEKIFGRFWTTADTRGVLELTLKSQQHASSYKDAIHIKRKK
ncbi:MAG: hypothetical protein KKE73_07970 [Proteobacteria bacterium]|nr:hypothetical protein [Pseudomonadota bacterium]